MSNKIGVFFLAFFLASLLCACSPDSDPAWEHAPHPLDNALVEVGDSPSAASGPDSLAYNVSNTGVSASSNAQEPILVEIIDQVTSRDEHGFALFDVTVLNPNECYEARDVNVKVECMDYFGNLLEVASYQIEVIPPGEAIVVSGGSSNTQHASYFNFRLAYPLIGYECVADNPLR